MLPLQYDLRLSAAKHNHITHAPAAANLDAAIPLRSAETELQNTLLHSSYTNCSSKTRFWRPSRKTTILKHLLKGIVKRKSSTPEWKNLPESTIRNFHAATTIRFTALSRNLPQFLAIEPHFVQKVARDAFEIIILRQFLAIESHFVRKSCDRTSANQNRMFTSVFGDRTSFRAKGLRGTLSKSRFLPQFLAIEPHFVRKGCTGRFQNHDFTAVFGDRTSFRAKGMRGTSANRNFTSVFAGRTSFRAKGLRFVPSRWHYLAV